MTLDSAPAALVNSPTMKTTFPNERTMEINIRVHSVVQLKDILGLLASAAVQENLEKAAMKHLGGS